MAIYLNGFENTPREQREKISVEEFQKIKNNYEIKYSDLLWMYVILKFFKRSDINIENYFEDFEVSSREEFIKTINKELGIDFESFDLEKLKANLSSKSEIDFNEIDAIINSIDVKNFSDLDEKKYIDECMKKLEKAFDEECILVAEELSKKDLSLIPPEMWGRTHFLKHINFQNTGAKLDFKEIISQAKGGSFRVDSFISSDNLKGCDLISFDPKIYHYRDEDNKEVDPFLDWETTEIKYLFENYDQKQLNTILQGFKNATYIPMSLINLLETEDIRSQNRWIIERIFVETKYNTDSIIALWQKLSFKEQMEFSNEFETWLQGIENDMLPDEYIKLCSATPSSLLKKNDEIIRNLIYSDNYYYNYAFSKYDQETKRNEFLNTDENDLIKRALILSNTDSEFILEHFLPLFEKQIAPRKGLDHYDMYHVSSIMEYFQNTKFNSQIMDRFFELAKDYYSDISKKVFRYLSTDNQKEYLYKYLDLGVSNKERIEDIAEYFKNMKFKLREEMFPEFLEYANNVSEKFGNYARGKIYLNNIFGDYDEKKQNEIFEKNPREFLISLRAYYRNVNNPEIDEKNEKQRFEFDSNYDAELAKVLYMLHKEGDLNESNINIIIDNIPKLGKDIVFRVLRSNSEMISANAGAIISAVATLPRKEAIETIEDTEKIFAKDNIPDFVKIYKFFENVVARKQQLINSLTKDRVSPELKQSKTARTAKRIIFSDLLNIALKSNNKSLKRFISILENGNEIYLKFIENGRDVSKISYEEQVLLKKYSDTLYTIYNETDASRIDDKEGKKIDPLSDHIDVLDQISRRYIGDKKPQNLSNEILKSILGRDYELLNGRTTIQEFKDYMQSVNEESNERHRKLAEKKLVLEEGDMIKGIREAKFILQDLFSNGIRAGEFLGISHHTDATPLDSDHSLITKSNIGQSISETINKTASSGYGDFFVVIKDAKNKMQFTRTLTDQNRYQSSLGANANKEQIRIRRNKKINDELEESKLETFYSGVVGDEHYGVRTGMSITDVDYIVVVKYDKRIGYELAMNGTYVPVIDYNTNEVLFSYDDYMEIRDKMKGLSYYETGDFEVDSTAKNRIIQEKINELFPNGDVKESISEKDARIKREAIERKVRAVLAEKMQIGVATKITGDLAPGFVEFIDTGSTGRGTNLLGDGDFDFSLKVDKAIMKKPEKIGKLREALREVLAIKSDHLESAITEVNGGDFRYKKIKIDGVDVPLDIDITFMEKTDQVTYSTDMAVKDRLQALKTSDSERI